VRKANPTWGGRKIHHVLRHQALRQQELRQQEPAAGPPPADQTPAAAPVLTPVPTPVLTPVHTPVPAASTITAILRRNGCLDPTASVQHKAFVRFAMATPNELWQMDYKGYFSLGDGVRCHPLTVLDDHSRFLLNLGACADERFATVKAQLTRLFACYGLPQRMLMDNGAPWGFDPQAGLTRPYHTRLSVWLLHLDVRVSHGRVRHPQTQGKEERLHRSLKQELLQQAPPAALANLAACQATFDGWRTLYNSVRPHEALDNDTPAQHYQPSPRPMPDTLPPIIYDTDMVVRTVSKGGRFAFRNREWRMGKAFTHYPVGIKPTLRDGICAIFFSHHQIAEIDLTQQTQRIQSVNYVSEHL
jgi:transposase InsO family protein